MFWEDSQIQNTEKKLFKNLSISLVIPCYNEEEGIKKVIENVPNSIDEIIVIDNNSTDKTASIAKSLGAKVVFEPRQGYGYAYQRGFREASKDIIVTGDGDYTYPVWDTPKILDYMVTKELDFISCNRFPIRNKEAMRISTYIGNILLTFAIRLCFFYPIKDSQSGMWVFKRELLSRIELTGGGMSLSEEIKIEVISNPAIKFKEYHIDYYPRVGASKIVKWKDGWKNFKFIFFKRISLWKRKARNH